MSDWNEYKLSDIIDIKHGYAFKGEFFSDEPTNNILVTPGNFKIGGGFKDNKLKYYKGDIPKDYMLSHEDIIVTMTDLSKQADTLGFSARVPNDNTKVFLHNQRIGLLQFKNSTFSSEFLYWLMRAEHYQKFVAGSATGATVKHTSPTKIRAFKFHAPSDNIVRKKIAKILSNYDDLIENNLKRIKLIEESARLTYEEWFIRFKIDGKKLEIDSETGLPFGWSNKKLANICEVSSSKRIFLSDYVENGVPFFRGKEITIKSQNKAIANEYFISEEKFNEIDNRFGSPKVNDILISAVGTLGSIYLVRESDGAFYFKDGNLLWLKEFKEDNSLLVYYGLKSEKLQLNILGIAIGSSQKALTIQALKLMELTCPDNSVNKRFNDKVRPLVTQIEILIHQNQLLKEARDILLPRLMTGMIDVEDMEISL